MVAPDFPSKYSYSSFWYIESEFNIFFKHVYEKQFAASNNIVYNYRKNKLYAHFSWLIVLLPIKFIYI